MTGLVTWIIWSDAAPLRSPTELGRCRAADKPDAERQAAARFPGRRTLVQSAASASVAAREREAPRGHVKAPVTTKPAHNPYSPSSRRSRRS